ncbi:FUSC family protein [Nocardioides panaciterrulae]|nr:aromatic acid exporter family protein [Nocardioides panaciterrulae]
MSPSGAVRDPRERWRERLHDPVFWTETLQVVKTVAAAVAAWFLATHVFHLPQSFLAPWSALLVVHATVYRTFSEGARQVGAAVLGVVVAWGVGNLLGLDATAVAVVLLAGLAVGTLPWLAGQGTAIAATALIVLTTGFAQDGNMLLMRLADTGIGIGVGLLVNLVVWPPLRNRTAISALNALDDEIGDLLQTIGDGLAAGRAEDEVADWIDRTRVLDEDLDRAWGLVRQARESARLNPRRSAVELRNPKLWMGLLKREEQAIAETRSMAQTILHGTGEDGEWISAFREPYVVLLRDTGAAILAADPMAILEVRDRLNRLVDRLAEESTPRLWPVYGGLIINLRNIIDAMDEVAKANPLDQPPLPFLRADQVSGTSGERGDQMSGA